MRRIKSKFYNLQKGITFFKICILNYFVRNKNKPFKVTSELGFDSVVSLFHNRLLVTTLL